MLLLTSNGEVLGSAGLNDGVDRQIKESKIKLCSLYYARGQLFKFCKQLCEKRVLFCLALVLNCGFL